MEAAAAPQAPPIAETRVNYTIGDFGKRIRVERAAGEEYRPPRVDKLPSRHPAAGIGYRWMVLDLGFDGLLVEVGVFRDAESAEVARSALELASRPPDLDSPKDYYAGVRCGVCGIRWPAHAPGLACDRFRPIGSPPFDEAELTADDRSEGVLP